MSQNRKPLDGIRVIDFTQLLPGPLCSQYLADMGAEVIKIEPPGRGDPVRGGPDNYAMLFMMINRNKRSFAVDLRSDTGQAQIRELLKSADVLIEGFRPGVMAKFGLDYQQLSKLNPALVYCSITGYGQAGPLAQQAGHDINYQALAGVLEQNGHADAAPATGNLPIADLAGGTLSAATGILAALFDASRSGQGRHVDIAMSDCLMALNVMATTSYQQQNNTPVPRGCDYLSGALACYQVYQTADERYLAVGAIEQKFWQAFCEAIKRPDLQAKGHLPGDAGRAVIADVAAVIAANPMSYWQPIFAQIDACTTPVLNVAQAIDHPHANARALSQTAQHPSGQTYRYYPCPIRMTDFTPTLTQHAPALGQDNDSILQGLNQSRSATDTGNSIRSESQ
ncbi:CoA transferase [Shewanella sp. NFH-SH190041]|uniref:CaiB/BaiF CoA transferase family protein n=1 Tax=Shewanella sp. NFH-SH190041 TaxID=2950245 RepID=UPI0021C4AB7C|nr:CaiB/BaiF CoA-transferase family protein [Shewanella sp. NFH-SH190041]BDM64376.1 CoA transferase [Shewanella sp. NFH-SH190041]